MIRIAADLSIPGVRAGTRTDLQGPVSAQLAGRLAAKRALTAMSLESLRPPGSRSLGENDVTDISLTKPQRRPLRVGPSSWLAAHFRAVTCDSREDTPLPRPCLQVRRVKPPMFGRT
jgi:hypothetical protein